jgi:hypothetical protein
MARETSACRDDGVGAARHLERQHRHAERFVLVVRIDTAPAHELGVESQRFARTEVLLHWAVKRSPLPTGGAS